MSTIIILAILFGASFVILVPVVYSDTFYYFVSWGSRLLSRKRSYLTPLMRWRIRRYVKSVNSWETLEHEWLNEGLHTLLMVEVRRKSDNATARDCCLLQFPQGISDKYGYSILKDCKCEAEMYLEEVTNDYAR